MRSWDPQFGYHQPQEYPHSQMIPKSYGAICNHLSRFFFARKKKKKHVHSLETGDLENCQDSKCSCSALVPNRLLTTSSAKHPILGVSCSEKAFVFALPPLLYGKIYFRKQNIGYGSRSILLYLNCGTIAKIQNMILWLEPFRSVQTSNINADM